MIREEEERLLQQSLCGQCHGMYFYVHEGKSEDNKELQKFHSLNTLPEVPEKISPYR